MTLSAHKVEELQEEERSLGKETPVASKASNATGQNALPGNSDTFIGSDHPRDGREWEAQCARCGSSLDWHQCDVCGGEGITAPGELYEDDPLWYDIDDYEACHQCGGEASFPYCMSSQEWCEAHPIKGREIITSGTPEWFVVNRDDAEKASNGRGVERRRQLPK